MVFVISILFTQHILELNCLTIEIILYRFRVLFKRLLKNVLGEVKYDDVVWGKILKDCLQDEILS